jgi:hypothetical protein
VAVVVAIVSSLVAAELLLIVTCVGSRLQVGESAAVPCPRKATVQVRLTIPVNPPVGVSWIVAVDDPPGREMAKPDEVVETVTEGAAPVRLADCGESPALSVIVNVPVRVPSALGENATAMGQLPPAGTEAGQVFVSAKSPEAAIDATLSGRFPVFISVIV